MENLKIRETNRTPKVNLDIAGIIEISGNSLIENTEQFYKKIQNWLEEYIKKPQKETTVTFNMYYYNTSSQMWIFQMFDTLTNLHRVGEKVIFNWHYCDIDIKESGEDLASLLNIDINFIHTKQEN